MDKFGGKDIEALAVALVLRDRDEEVRNEWARHLSTDDKIPFWKTLSNSQLHSHTIYLRNTKPSTLEQLPSNLAPQESSQRLKTQQPLLQQHHLSQPVLCAKVPATL